MGGAMRRTARAAVSRSHTTWTEASALLLEHVRLIPHVSKIACGIIRANAGPGQRRVKMTEERGGILLTIRGNLAVQEMRLYAPVEKMQDVKLAVARTIRNLGFHLSFRKDM